MIVDLHKETIDIIIKEKEPKKNKENSKFKKSNKTKKIQKQKILVLKEMDVNC